MPFHILILYNLFNRFEETVGIFLFLLLDGNETEYANVSRTPSIHCFTINHECTSSQLYLFNGELSLTFLKPSL